MKPALREIARRAVIAIATLGVVAAAASGPRAFSGDPALTGPTLQTPAARNGGAPAATARVIRG